MDRFQYQPLANTRDGIRIVKVLTHDESTDEVSCELIETSIALSSEDGSPEIDYVALSYTWGNPEPTRFIELNQRQFEVRQNLFDFLTKSSLSQNGVWLWIDAICIDQDNLQERSQQVHLMSQIYARAKQAVVWLGHQDLKVEWLFSVLSLSNAHVDDARRDYLQQQPQSEDDEYTRFESAADAVDKLTYWKRLWIYQEVFLAAHRTCSYRHWVVPWTKLARVIKRKHAHAWPLFTVISERDKEIHFARKVVEAKKPSLARLLHTFRYCQCSVRHDHVYALLSLAHYGTYFPINYESTMLELLVETLAFAVRARSDHITNDNMPILRELAERLSSNLGCEDGTKENLQFKTGLQIANQPMHGMHKKHDYNLLLNEKTEHPWFRIQLKGESEGQYLQPTADEETGLDQGDTDRAHQISEQSQYDILLPYIRRILQLADTVVLEADLVIWSTSQRLAIFARAIETKEHSGHYEIIARASFEIEEGSSAQIKFIRGQLERYENWLRGVELNISGTDGEISASGLMKLTFTDVRPFLVLFALPFSSDVRKAAIALMSHCGGDPALMKIAFYELRATTDIDIDSQDSTNNALSLENEDLPQKAVDNATTATAPKTSSDFMMVPFSPKYETEDELNKLSDHRSTAESDYLINYFSQGDLKG